MGFKVKHGGPSAMAKLGALAGEAEAGIRAEKMAFDSAQRLRELEHNTRLAEMQVDARMAAKEQDIAFELQKYAMTQQNDFMVREEIRTDKIRLDSVKQQRKEAEYEAQVEAIRSQMGETVSNEEGERAILNLGLPPGAQLPTIAEEDRYERTAELVESQETRSQEYHDRRMKETPQEKMYRELTEKTKTEQLVELRKEPTVEEFQESSDRNEVIVRVVGGAERGVHKSMSIDDARPLIAAGEVRPVMVPEEAMSASVKRKDSGNRGSWSPQYPVPGYLLDKPGDRPVPRRFVAFALDPSGNEVEVDLRKHKELKKKGYEFISRRPESGFFH